MSILPSAPHSFSASGEGRSSTHRTSSHLPEDLINEGRIPHSVSGALRHVCPRHSHVPWLARLARLARHKQKEKAEHPESLHAERLTSMLWCNLSVSELGNGLYGSFVSCLYTSSSISSYAGHGSVRFSGARFHLRSPSTGSRMYRLTSTTQWRCYWCYETVADNRTVADNSSLHKVLPKMLTSTQLPASHLTNHTKSYMIITIIIPWSIVSYSIPMKLPPNPYD